MILIAIKYRFGCGFKSVSSLEPSIRDVAVPKTLARCPAVSTLL